MIGQIKTNQESFFDYLVLISMLAANLDPFGRRSMFYARVAPKIECETLQPYSIFSNIVNIVKCA